MCELIDVSDLTDDAVLKILIERERKSIIGQRQLTADSAAEDQKVRDYIKENRTDEG